MKDVVLDSPAGLKRKFEDTLIELRNVKQKLEAAEISNAEESERFENHMKSATERFAAEQKAREAVLNECKILKEKVEGAEKLKSHLKTLTEDLRTARSQNESKESDLKRIRIERNGLQNEQQTSRQTNERLTRQVNELTINRDNLLAKMHSFGLQVETLTNLQQLFSTEIEKVKTSILPAFLHQYPPVGPVSLQSASATHAFNHSGNTARDRPAADGLPSIEISTSQLNELGSMLSREPLNIHTESGSTLNFSSFARPSPPVPRNPY